MNSSHNSNQNPDCFLGNNFSKNNTLMSMNNVVSKMLVTLEAIPEAVVWVNEDGEIQWFNCAFRQLVAKSDRDIFKAKLIEILPLSIDKQPVDTEAYPDVRIQQEKYETREYEFSRAETSLVLEISGDCILENDNKKTAILFIKNKQVELARQQAEKALEQQLQRVLLLEKITQDIRKSLDLKQVFQTTVHQIGDVFQVDRCQIFDYHFQPTTTACVVEEYLVPNYASTLGIAVTLQDAACLDKAFTKEQAEVCANVYQEPSLQRSIPVYRQFQVKSLMAVRTSYQGKPNGAIVVHQCDRFRQWTQAEIELLEAVAAQVGIAIAQAKLLAQEKQQRQALEEAKQKAEVAKLAKSEFLANMSHEFRTPLNAILGFTQLMARDEAITPKQKKSLSIIHNSGEHLLNLINDVLEMSKIEKGETELQPKVFSLHRLLHDLQLMFQPLAQAKQLSLQFELARGLIEYIKTDRVKLRQVLINLLDNAIKFTQTGSVVLRVLSLREIAMGNVVITTNKAKLIFEIEDTGIGIAEKEMELLFKPFIQTTADIPKLGGTGLGLAISQHFVNLMGGKINLVSTLGEGSIFSFGIQVDLAPSSTCKSTYEPMSTVICPEIAPTKSVNCQDLSCMTPQWITKLYHAAIAVDADLLKQLVAQIPSTHQSLATALEELIGNYDFDRIVELSSKDIHKQY